MTTHAPTGDDNNALINYRPGVGILTDVPPEKMREAFPAPPPQDPYTGLSSAPFSPEAQAVLQAPLPDNEIAIRPDDGNLYLPGGLYRTRLNKAFGLGGWAFKPAHPPEVRVSGGATEVYYTGQLYVLGRFAAEAMGMGNYFPNSARSNYGNALESAKTDSLTRACKYLGIACELWDPVFARAWRADRCVEIRNPDVKRFGSKASRVWVRKDDPCLSDAVREEAPAPNLPKVSRSKATGQEIIGAWPKAPWVDPSTQGAREMDDEYRRTMGAPARTDLEVQLQRSIDANTIEVIDKRTGVVTTEVKATSAQIARIHILQREMNIPDDGYRGGLEKYYGVSTSALLTKAQAEDAIFRLERFKARAPREMLHVVPPTESDTDVDHALDFPPPDDLDQSHE